MKTTMELPDDLMREIKMRAVRAGRKLKDEIAELLQLGLRRADAAELAEPTIVFDDRGFPVMGGGKQPKNHTLTPEKISEILLEQEDERYRNSA